MQARPDAAGRAVIRFALNSTFGLLGLFDVATPMGVTQEPLDFGLTLGRWGVGNGPYLVVPVLGPVQRARLLGLRRRYRRSPSMCRRNRSSPTGSTSIR